MCPKPETENPKLNNGWMGNDSLFFRKEWPEITFQLFFFVKSKIQVYAREATQKAFKNLSEKQTKSIIKIRFYMRCFLLSHIFTVGT